MAHSDAGKRNAQQENLKTLGIRLFKPPPADFDPLEAGDRELLIYGYPARPNVDTYPELYEHWRQLMSRPMTSIEPQFGRIPDWLERRPRASVDTAGDGWSGAAVVPTAGDAFRFVGGTWTVPHVIFPETDQDVSGCAIWVGLDGWNGAPNAGSDILQAGTTQAVLNTPFESFTREWAWFEWWPHEPQTVNLPVAAGDVMSYIICVNSPTEAHVFMANYTMGVRISFIKSAPDNLQVVGGSAEWVLENPSSGWLGPLPKFGTVYFDSCFASAVGGKLYLLSDSHSIKMYNTDGKYIATPQVVTRNLMKIDYTAPP